MTDLQTELAESRAFQLRLAERIAAASEVLSHLAERKGAKMSEQPEPVPRTLFEAAIAMLADGPGRWACADKRFAIRAAAQPGETLFDTAERIIRRAAACGVGEEGRGCCRCGRSR